MLSDPFFKKRGLPLPLGATIQQGGINFAIFSRNSEKVTLVLSVEEGQNRKIYEISLDSELHRTGNIWHIMLQVDPKRIRYGYKIDGNSVRGSFFSEKTILLDPYAKKIRAKSWGTPGFVGELPLCEILDCDFDWQGDTPLKTPWAETIIYELHPRGYTRHISSRVTAPGTFKGLMEKIEYFKELGITAVELMPVTEFDENDTAFFHPDSRERLKNFWGYNPISFFAVKSAYASDVENHLAEFKTMVRTFHQAGIEVILDMVFNHSGEGDYDRTTSSFRGIDNSIYYLLDPDSCEYLNFSGCGNTLNCNHPVVRELIRDALRYWVVEMHIDGFRFDLASVLGRDQDGAVLSSAPVIEMIAEDPVLRDTKIIAEAWDASGLYQVGSFSNDRRWAEWNGRYRDDVRAFFAGHRNTVANLATRIAGSSDLYQTSCRSPLNSINFITSHDGFTLYDLVSYEQKHNQQNGEKNRDGENYNISWNSGLEGDTTDGTVVRLRMRRMKSLVTVLLLSQGVPMITAGDEFGRTQQGNNNSWCQDNEISWVDWSMAQKNQELLRFFQGCIDLRKTYRTFTREKFFSHVDNNGGDDQLSEIIWQGLEVGIENWSQDCHHLAFLLPCGDDGLEQDDFFVMINGHREDGVVFTVPAGSKGNEYLDWRKIIDTSMPAPDDLVPYKDASGVSGRQQVPAQTVVVLQASNGLKNKG